MRYSVRAAAKRDLRAILDYGAVNHGASAAVEFLQSFDPVFERIADYPLLYALVEGMESLRSKPHRGYRIFYRIEREAVEIIRVLHQARDYARHLN